MKTKSFRYNPTDHPKIEKWIQTLEKTGINFSTAIRRLIEDSEIEKDRIQKELEAMKRQIETMRTTGYRPDIPEQAATEETETEREPVAVDPGFIRNRYFS